MDLKVDPERNDDTWQFTGIWVRATFPDGKVGNADIIQLDKESLTNWLRKDGDDESLAERTLIIILGHNR